MFPSLLALAPTVAVYAQSGALTKPPELVQFVEAPFPASETGKTGSVVLALTLAADGTVEAATVQETSGVPAFDEAAVAAALQFVFTPAEIDGKPARVGILYRYDFVEKAAAPTTAVYTGIIRDRDTGAPVPGVTVTLSDGRTVQTDEAGRFEVRDVPPGPQSVSLSGERLTATMVEESFVAGEQLDVTYDVFLSEEGEGDDLEILVYAPAVQRQAVSTAVAAEEARKVPGTQGDVLRVVENLPGVARASLGTGALVVWGAAPDDTTVYIDGVPVPRLYHDGGLRSVVGSDFVESVELVPGGYGAAWGRGLGGLVSVSTQRFDEALHASASADLYDAALAAGGPLGDRVTFGVGGRFGYVSRLLGAFYPEVEDFFPIPNYTDAQARLGWKISSNQRIEVTGLMSTDVTTRTAPSSHPAREASEERSLDFQRLWVRYTHDLGDGQVTAVVYGGADQSSQIARFGAVETSIETRVQLLGLRLSQRSRLSDWLTAEAGLDALVPRTRVERNGSVSLPPREGDVRVFGQPPPDQISTDTFEVVSANVAPYAELQADLLDGHLQIVPGLRLDPYARSVSKTTPEVVNLPTVGLFDSEIHVEPRLLVRVAPSEGAWATAAAGLYGQPPAATDLSASFGNPTLPISSGRHLVLGGGVRPLDPLSVEVTGFYTSSDGLAVRNPAEQPAVAEALVPIGSGRTYGVQALVRLDPVKGVFGWLSYTLAYSERRNAPGEDWRWSDYDQRHVLTALGGADLPGGFETGVRVRVSSGFPRTEVTGAYYDLRRDLWQPTFGEQNGIRIPTFFQADLRVARHFDLGRSALDLSFEVQNVTNRANAEELIYNADYTEVGTIRGLPILPVLGARWSL